MPRDDRRRRMLFVSIPPSCGRQHITFRLAVKPTRCPVVFHWRRTESGLRPRNRVSRSIRRASAVSSSMRMKTVVSQRVRSAGQQRAGCPRPAGDGPATPSAWRASAGACGSRSSGARWRVRRGAPPGALRAGRRRRRPARRSSPRPAPRLSRPAGPGSRRRSAARRRPAGRDRRPRGGPASSCRIRRRWRSSQAPGPADGQPSSAGRNAGPGSAASGTTQAPALGAGGVR